VLFVDYKLIRFVYGKLTDRERDIEWLHKVFYPFVGDLRKLTEFSADLSIYKQSEYYHRLYHLINFIRKYLIVIIIVFVQEIGIVQIILLLALHLV